MISRLFLLVPVVALSLAAGILLLEGACSYERPASVAFTAPGSAGTVLYALSNDARMGTINTGKPRPLEYRFQEAPVVPADYALELDYYLIDSGSNAASAYELVFQVSGDAAWTLPRDAAFLGWDRPLQRVHYRIPLTVSRLEGFRISLESQDGTLPEEPSPFTLQGLSLVPRWYGFVRDEEAGTLRASPFVFAAVEEGENPSRSFVINPPPVYRIAGTPALFLRNAGKRAVVDVGSARYNYHALGDEGTILSLPAGSPLSALYPLRISAGILPEAVELTLLPATPNSAVALPVKAPIPADPGVILTYPQESWRDRRYELFQWEDFPSILILDIADYAIQDRLLKRLAFFTEKAGFRGRLAADAEIARLHGWNAHDYRAEDLARFFEIARQTQFPLLPEERELETILLAADIIRQDSSSHITSGRGALISISRESPDSLRRLFMAHEGFHGLFFIDEDFRNFSQTRWENLSPLAKTFIYSFFDYQSYDINDAYLMVNEFQAHCLQQSVSQAAQYFGDTLAGRINASPWRRTVLPPRNEETGTWPELAQAFSREAEQFSAYVGRRWGLAAGRVWRVIP